MLLVLVTRSSVCLSVYRHESLLNTNLVVELNTTTRFNNNSNQMSRYNALIRANPKKLATKLTETTTTANTETARTHV